MTAEPGWALALEHAAASRIVLVLGDSDSGKTSLTTWLAASLARPHRPVGVVDADLGQSRIGPPTTVGLGRVAEPVESLTDAELVSLVWVGRTSPPGVERALLEATGRLVGRAVAAGLPHVLVDTCGLVRGPRGAGLKLGEIRRVAPDLVICLQRADECDPILRELAGASRPAVLTLPVGPCARRRSQEERRRRRLGSLDAYFADASASVVAFEAVDGLDAAATPPIVADLADTLVGLLDDRGETLGIGRIAGVDRPGRRLHLESPVASARVTRVALGTEKFRPAGIVEAIR